MIKKLRSLKNNSFIRNNSMLFIAGVLTGAVNYALYPAISRFITVEEFGEIQILLSLILQLSIAGMVIRVFIVNTLKDEKSQKVKDQFIRNTTRTMLLLSLVLAGVFLLLSPLIKDALQFQSIWPLLPTSLAIVLGFQFMIAVAYLESQQIFDKVSMLRFGQAFSKFLVAAALAIVGLGTNGVIWGVVIAGAYILWRARSHVDSFGRKSTYTSPSFSWAPLKKQLGYITIIGSTLGVVFVLVSLDTFFVKYYFEPEPAGQYAGVSVVARTLFYLTGSISAVLIASVKPTKKLKENTRTLIASLGLMTAISAPAIAFIYLFDDYVVRLLLGSKFLEYGNLLTVLSIAMFGLGLVNLITSYHVALKERLIVVPSVGGLIITTLLISLNHESFDVVAHAFTIGIWITLALCIAWSVLWHYNYHEGPTKS